MKSIHEIKNNIALTLDKLPFNEYSLNDFLENIKKSFLRENINKYNVYNLKNHRLRDENNFKKDDICYLKLLYNEEFNFNNIEEEIKKVFNSYSVEDRIKELMPYLMLEKYFKNKQSRYFSLYDFSKTIKDEEIKNTINSLKELCFSAYLNDKYNKVQTIKDILEFIKWAFNISLSLEGFDLYDNDLKKVEQKINESQKDFKIRLFENWYYLSFTKEENNILLKEMVIKSIISRKNQLLQ